MASLGYNFKFPTLEDYETATRVISEEIIDLWYWVDAEHQIITFTVPAVPSVTSRVEELLAACLVNYTRY